MAAVNDPIDLLLDSTGDLDLSLLTDLQMSTGLQAVTQGVTIRINTFKNEWFLNLDTGLDWFGRILGQKFNKAVVHAELRRVILDTDDDITIRTLESTFDAGTRELSISLEISTVFGDTAIELEFTI